MSPASGFPAAAPAALADGQLRANLRHATHAIRDRRAEVVDEVPDWEALRAAGESVKQRAMAELDRHLEALEAAVLARGGTVHWARDAAEANATVARLVHATGARDVVKVKSMATDEIGLNDALAAEGIAVDETDLAELVVQLAGDRPSHILVPAIHRNRTEIAELFRRALPGAEDVGDDPAALAEAARRFLRERFLTARVAVSGANFAVAETGSVCVVESEGNGRMCTTLPETLITVMGIEKVVPSLDDLGIMLRLLPRSSTGERMNPYTSLWTGVAPGDGPRAFHLVLLDNGRTDALADPTGRQALHCIRCSACLNVCPVYERTGGHAYGDTYPGPIGAILAPQLHGLSGPTSTLPFASTLCGACADVCPVRIDIPGVLLHLRGRVVREARRGDRASGERLAMEALGRVFAGRRRYEAAQRAARAGRGVLPAGSRLPGPLRAWSGSRELPRPAAQSFRDWWRTTREVEAP